MRHMISYRIEFRPETLSIEWRRAGNHGWISEGGPGNRAIVCCVLKVYGQYIVCERIDCVRVYMCVCICVCVPLDRNRKGYSLSPTHQTSDKVVRGLVYSPLPRSLALCPCRTPLFSVFIFSGQREASPPTHRIQLHRKVNTELVSDKTEVNQ